MARKRNPRKKHNPNHLIVSRKPDEDSSDAIARMVLNPTAQAAVTLKEYGKIYGKLDLSSLIDSLTEQTQATIDGDLKRTEASLTAQAHTLDAIFNNLARRAINAEYMDNLDRYLKLALRAQSQCRATWEALANIKHPPIIGYVRQANIAHGPQQVNNTSRETSKASCQTEKPNLQNKLLEEKDGERLDTGATGAAVKTDPEMETLEKVDRAKDADRKMHCFP